MSIQTRGQVKKTFHQQWMEQYCLNVGFVKLVSQANSPRGEPNFDIEPRIAPLC
jgi:hypothetical protein